MARWNCGASSCTGHPRSSDRCPTGTWHCSRTNPACPGHAHPSDRCANPSGARWSCHADGCAGNHANPSDQCSPGVWRCGRSEPPCSGHQVRDHLCRGDLTRSSTDCDAHFSSSTPSSHPHVACPRADRIRLVQIVEVIIHNSAETRRAVSGRSQYINLDDQVDTSHAHPEYGRLIRFRARVEWESGDRSRPLSGHNVYWYFRPGGSNKTGLAQSARASFDSAGSGTTQKQTSTDGQGWTPVVPFYLSQYNGDIFNVFATLESSYSGGLPAGPYEVWKKFWYQVTEMQDGSGGVYDLPGAVKSAFESGYQSVKIELNEQTPRRRDTHVANLTSASARASAASPHFTSDSLCPFKFQVMTLDHSETPSQTRDITATMNAATWTSPDYYWLWRLDSGNFPWKISAEFKLASQPLWACRRTNPACTRNHSNPSHRHEHQPAYRWSCGAVGCGGTHSDPTHVCSGRIFRCKRRTPPCETHPNNRDRCPSPSGAVWDCGAINCPGHPSSSENCGTYWNWQAIPDSAISTQTHPSQRGAKQIAINFSSGPITPSATARIDIRLRIKEAGPNFPLGWGGGSKHIYLCTGALHDLYEAADWNPTQSSDLVHELGHALGLVNMNPAASGAHNAWVDSSHANHCRKPATQCAMWWQSSTTRLTTFHLDGGTGCRDHLRRQDFSRSVMAGHWGS